MKEEDLLKEAIEIEEELKKGIVERKNNYKSPILLLISLIVLLALILWVIPPYSIKYDPVPVNVPTREEVIPKGFEELKGVDASFKLANIYQLANFVKSDDSDIKKIADKIAVASCKSERNFKVCYAKAMYQFIRDNYQYINDPVGIEYIEDPKVFLGIGGGDCESGSIALASLMESVGIGTHLVLISNHAYIRVYLPEAKSRYKRSDGWIYLDWTCSECDFGEIPITDIEKEFRFIG